MSLTKSIRHGLVAVASLLIGAAAQAAPVAWSNNAGVSTDFSWSNGANENGLANDPVHINGTFIFIPSGLKAVAINTSNTVSELIHITLTPATGKRISSITASFSGDASVQGAGDAGIDAVLDAFDHVTTTHAINAIAPSPITDQGTFDESFTLDVPQNFGTLDLTLTANVNAIAQDGSAVAEMKVIRLAVNTVPASAVPLPAAVLTFPAGAFVAALGAKRMKLRK